MGKEEKFGATDGDIRRAQQNAEAFTKAKAKDFAEQFYQDSGILDALYEKYQKERATNVAEIPKDKFLKQLIQDNEFIFGKALAITYALAYIDGKQGKTVQELIVGFKHPVAKPQLVKG